jgi:hypothetical protein
MLAENPKGPRMAKAFKTLNMGPLGDFGFLLLTTGDWLAGEPLSGLTGDAVDGLEFGLSMMLIAAHLDTNDTHNNKKDGIQVLKFMASTVIVVQVRRGVCHQMILDDKQSLNLRRILCLFVFLYRNMRELLSKLVYRYRIPQYK